MIFNKSVRLREELDEAYDKMDAMQAQLKTIKNVCRHALIFDKSEGLDREYLEEIHERICGILDIM